jgi:hypothetical protein
MIVIAASGRPNCVPPWSGFKQSVQILSIKGALASLKPVGAAWSLQSVCLAMTVIQLSAHICR